MGGGTTPPPNRVNIKMANGFHFRVILGTLTGALTRLNTKIEKRRGRQTFLRGGKTFIGHVDWFSTVRRTSPTMNFNTFSCINFSLFAKKKRHASESTKLTSVDVRKYCGILFNYFYQANGANYELLDLY